MKNSKQIEKRGDFGTKNNLCESVNLFGLQQLSKTGSANYVETKAAVATLGKAVQLAAASEMNVVFISDFDVRENF